MRALHASGRYLRAAYRIQFSSSSWNEVMKVGIVILRPQTHGSLARDVNLACNTTKLASPVRKLRRQHLSDWGQVSQRHYLYDMYINAVTASGKRNLSRYFLVYNTCCFSSVMQKMSHYSPKEKLHRKYVSTQIKTKLFEVVILFTRPESSNYI